MPSFKPEKVRRALKSKGFREEKKKKDHYFYYLEVEGRTTNIFTKVSHTNKKEIGKPLFSKIARDLGVTPVFLAEFIKCPKTHEDLVAELRENNLI